MQVQPQQSVLRLLVMVVAPAAASELPPGAFGSRVALKAAVDDLSAAEAEHGPIAGWDTSRIDDMTAALLCEEHVQRGDRRLGHEQGDEYVRTFLSATVFNPQLVWDTSKVTNMKHPFQSAFNQSSPGTPARRRTCGPRSIAPTAFNSELVWDTSSVTNFDQMFFATALASDADAKQ